jgi:hypothetical protein
MAADKSGRTAAAYARVGPGVVLTPSVPGYRGVSEVLRRRSS